MSTLVIDATGGLWQIDPDAEDDNNTIPVERPPCQHCGHRPTARIAMDDAIVAPGVDQLFELDHGELARFGLTRDRALRKPIAARTEFKR